MAACFFGAIGADCVAQGRHAHGGHRLCGASGYKRHVVWTCGEGEGEAGGRRQPGGARGGSGAQSIQRMSRGHTWGSLVALARQEPQASASEETRSHIGEALSHRAGSGCAVGRQTPGERAPVQCRRRARPADGPTHVACMAALSASSLYLACRAQLAARHRGSALRLGQADQVLRAPAHGLPLLATRWAPEVAGADRVGLASVCFCASCAPRFSRGTHAGVRSGSPCGPQRVSKRLGHKPWAFLLAFLDPFVARWSASLLWTSNQQQIICVHGM